MEVQTITILAGMAAMLSPLYVLFFRLDTKLERFRDRFDELRDDHNKLNGRLIRIETKLGIPNDEAQNIV